MTKALLAFLLLLVARSASAQALQPGETGAPDLTSGIQSPLQPAIRSQLEQALQSRDYPRAEAVLAKLGESPFRIGETIPHRRGRARVEYR